MTVDRTTVNGAGRSAARSVRDFEGQILMPGDAAYDQARAVWNAIVDKRPAIIMRCTSASDVGAAVRFGREQGMEIGVRGGGHSVLGLSIPDGGLMVDLSPLGAVASIRTGAGHGWKVVPSLAPWTAPHGPLVWPPRRATFPTPASAG
jgi:hypothetical protein